MFNRKKYHRDWLSRNRDKRKKHVYKYNHSEKRKLVRRRYYLKNKEKYRVWSSEWKQKNIEKSRSYARRFQRTPKGRLAQKRYAEKHRIKRLAKDAVHNAVKRGRLIRMACYVCGNKKSEGHHRDYTKPLQVVWLCKKHHSSEHKEMRNN